jgi:hypothetical protein
MAECLTKTGMFLSATLLLLGAAVGEVEAGSQYVIVAAEPPADAYAPGMVLDVDDTIDIPAGTVVTLLGEDGSVNAIPGPVSVTVTEDSVETVGDNGEQGGQEKKSTLSKIADLIAGEKKNADTLGVARSFSSRPKPKGLDDPWVISIHGDGAGCLREGDIRLGRKSDKETISLAISGNEGTDPVELTMREGVSEITLPKSLDVTAGEIFVKTSNEQALIQLHGLPKEINAQNPVEMLGWMINSGCKEQALAFTRQLVLEAQ